MTLVIAGYMFDDQTAAYVFRSNSTKRESNAAPTAEPNGIFIAADSTISTNGNPPKTLLSGFQKIYDVKATLWQPYFIDGYFKDYLTEHSSCQLLLAFAGSTLTAQHYLNSIRKHLQNLRISNRERTIGEHDPIEYMVRLICETNPVESGGFFSNDIYTPNDMQAFKLTADDLAHAIRHSMEHAMKSAKKYKLDRNDFNSLKTPFIAGIQCPTTKKYRLFQFEISETINLNEQISMSIDMTEVPPNQVAVLGMNSKFGQRAQEAYDRALAAKRSTQQACFDFLQEAIAEEQKEGGKAIDLPAFLNTLESRGITKNAVPAPEAE